MPSFRAARASGGASLVVPVVGCLAGAACFVVVESLLAARWPGTWAESIAIGVAGLPVGRAWAHSSGRSSHIAWKSAGWFAFASAALYAWIFGGGWI